MAFFAGKEEQFSARSFKQFIFHRFYFHESSIGRAIVSPFATGNYLLLMMKLHAAPQFLSQNYAKTRLRQQESVRDKKRESDFWLRIDRFLLVKANIINF
jgi:hypothetical protein